MTENQLIKQLKQLKSIKPRKEWVILSKQEILREEPAQAKASVFINELFSGMKFVFSHKYAFSPVVVVLVLFGAFGFAQKSVPGDLLFPVKKISEQTQTALIMSQDELGRRNLEIVNKRLDDLKEITQTNSNRKLSPAISEYQASVSEMAKSIAKQGANNDSKEVRNIVEDVKRIEQRTTEIKSLGVEVGENIDLDMALVNLISAQLQDLEKKALTIEQMNIMVGIKTDLESGAYADALEKLVDLNQQIK